MSYEDKKKEFIEIYNKHIKRDGADKLLDYLENRSDFFTAPASSQYHLSRVGGLCEHSINVYNCLLDYLSRPKVKEEYGLAVSDETAAIAALLHDVCKTDCYVMSTRNKKDKVTGKWTEVPFYEYKDKMPYGHGEKSVYIISGFVRLSREEAFAIRYHMGYSNTDDTRNVSAAFEMYPLAFALSTADMEATYFIENKESSDI
ncbi:MAG: hydrolase [Clostridia bacterium]|nr:hydrolase [Clostridia bacterium]